MTSHVIYDYLPNGQRSFFDKTFTKVPKNEIKQKK